jgi:hypothetical protein
LRISQPQVEYSDLAPFPDLLEHTVMSCNHARSHSYPNDPIHGPSWQHFFMIKASLTGRAPSSIASKPL